MADDHHTGPLELGAEMDYAEHEKTYDRFLDFTKYGTIAVCSLMIAMAFGFFTAAGFVSALVLFVLLTAVGSFLMR